jgi:hypothetical protein
MGGLMPDCKEVTEMVSRSLDEPMPFFQRMRMGMHLAMCRYCSRFKRQLQFLREAVKGARVPPEFGPDRPGLSPEARQRIKLALREGAVE